MLLGEEETESVEIDLACVDIGLAEVSVDREGSGQGRKDPVVRIETRRVFEVVTVLDAVVDSAKGSSRHDVEPDANAVLRKRHPL